MIINLTSKELTPEQVAWFKENWKDKNIEDLGKEYDYSGEATGAIRKLSRHIRSLIQNKYDTGIVVDGSNPFLLIDLVTHISSSIGYRTGARDAHGTITVVGGIPEAPTWFLWNEKEGRYDIL